MELAQERMQGSNDKHRREVDFVIGDKVWLDMQQYRSGRPSRKLSNPSNGPFEIIEKVGHSWRLKLPSTMKVHDVYSPERLRKDPDDPLEGQELAPGETLDIAGNLEYEVESILAAKKVRQKLFYQVAWVGFDDDLEWYPVSDLKYSPHKIRDFHLKYPGTPGLPHLAKVP
jgi:hypothetical protein